MVETEDLQKLNDVVRDCYSWSSLYRSFYGHGANGSTLSKFKRLHCDLIDTSHFTGNGRPPAYDKVTKVCPVCGKSFETLRGNPGEQYTCSHACSNTFFRSGENNPNWKGENYRHICFSHYGKKCAICDESLIVEVHHMDENRMNNSPSNLVPLCPTHHQYWHSRYRYLIHDDVMEYVNNR